MQKKYYVGGHVVTTHHTAFFVADLEESVQFYQETFGFEVLYYGVVEVAHERLAMLRLGNFTLELLWVPPPHPRRAPGKVSAGRPPLCHPGGRYPRGEGEAAEASQGDL